MSSEIGAEIIQFPFQGARLVNSDQGAILGIDPNILPSELARLKSLLQAALHEVELLDQTSGSHELADETIVEPELAEATKSSTIITHESIANYLEFAHQGYGTVIDVLNKDRNREDKITTATKDQIEAEFHDWFSDDKLAYIQAVQEVDPSIRFTLVASPNVLASRQEIKNLAKDFGDSSGALKYSTIVEDKLIEVYTSEELSGTNPSNGKSVIFSLIPNKADEVAYLPRGDQPFDHKQTDLWITNGAFLQIPSVLEALTYWYVLQASEDLNGEMFNKDPYNLSFIHHFNLPQIDDGEGHQIMLSTYIFNGRAIVGQAYAPDGYTCRFAVKDKKSFYQNH